jgi:hypothetical protein
MHANPRPTQRQGIGDHTAAIRPNFEAREALESPHENDEDRRRSPNATSLTRTTLPHEEPQKMIPNPRRCPR